MIIGVKDRVHLPPLMASGALCSADPRSLRGDRRPACAMKRSLGRSAEHLSPTKLLVILLAVLLMPHFTSPELVDYITGGLNPLQGDKRLKRKAGNWKRER